MFSFLTPKILKNKKFADEFRGYRKGTFVWNQMKDVYDIWTHGKVAWK